MNVSRNVVRGRTFWPDRPSLIFEGHTISYRDLDQDSNRAANPLRGLGIERGDRVAMINRSGFKIWPSEVEQLLYRHPAVTEVAVVPADFETIRCFHFLT